jgi:stromal membrane-associated protein
MVHLTCSAAAPVPSSEKKDSAKPVESKPQSAAAGLEDLFKDSPPVPLSSAPAVSQANVKNDIMSLFEKVSCSPPFMTNLSDKRFYCQKKGCNYHLLKKYLALQSNMVSPFAVHQQQLAFMSQQQALLMAALKAGNAPQITPANVNLLNANGSNAPQGSLPFQNWANLGYQNPGSISTVAQNGAAKVNPHRSFYAQYLNISHAHHFLAGW